MMSALDLVKKRIVGIEECYLSWGGPELAEMAMLIHCEWRQALVDPEALIRDPRCVRRRFCEWKARLAGHDYNGPLWLLLKEHDALQQHPKLLGDFARWLETAT